MVRRWRPTVAVVDLEAIAHNVRALAPAPAQLMAVVKANGYGHGATPVARTAVAAGASWLGVALVEEGVRLREAGIEAPILVLTEFPPGSEVEALAARLTPTVYTGEGLARLLAAPGGPRRVHLKIDTGMHRVGIAPEAAVEFALRAAAAGVEIEGVMTHLAVSEEPDNPFTEEQERRFEKVVAELAGAGIRPRYRHVANTGGLLGWPGTHLDLVRAGIGVYGIGPGPEAPGPPAGLRPALSWRSAVSLVKRVAAGEGISYGLTYRPERETTIATVPVGYADGYSRSLSNRGRVLIRGRRYPVAGTVTMDQLMVDCGDDPVEAWDEVVLVGRQGDDEISADEVAGWMETIPYEVICAISERVPREYVVGA